MKTETKLDLSFALGIGICIIVITAALLWALPATAQKVKYCKNYTTGEIITVTAGMPCPYPTSEI
jgi:hypothetical protein